MGRTKQNFPVTEQVDIQTEAEATRSDTPKTKKKRLHEEDPQAFTGDDRRKIQKAKNSKNWRQNQKQKMASLKMQLASVKKENASLKKEMNTLRGENVYLKEKHYTQVKRQNHSSRKQLVSPMLEDYVSTKEENVILRDENLTMENKIHSLQKEVSFLKGEEHFQIIFSLIHTKLNEGPAEISMDLENSRACSSGKLTQLMECSNSTDAKPPTKSMTCMEMTDSDSLQESVPAEMTDSDIQQAPIPYMERTLLDVPQAGFELEIPTTDFQSPTADEKIIFMRGGDGDKFLCDFGDMETDYSDDSDSE